ncbi:site-specific DNA-methyltransferase [Aggregatilinea lenta]|uniref:site-specific DNA-methyltransferase n=1 Tax=Aggregatilinea lenta TaxID=913108 RepID=UPI000E5ABE0F|nr:DNA methyltransferase [Aggregatilinea lenta]
MTPYADLPLDQILHGDCLDLLASFPDKSVDMIFADPPYNLQLQRELWRPNMTKVDAVDADWDQFNSFADYDAFTREWLHACQRVLKDTGTIWVIGTYHNIFRVGAILMDLNYWILNQVVWVKTNPTPNFRGVRFTNAHETLLWAQKEKGARYTFNYHAMKALNDDLQMRSDWWLPTCVGPERIKLDGKRAHPTQKPEALLYRVVLSSSRPGDVILDPFFGTGTTGAVAKKLHRRWIGIEKEAEYVRLAQERLDAVEPFPQPDVIFTSPERRQRPRIAFGTLLERGLVTPGQTLYFGKHSATQATILASGHLQCGELSGSIHKVGRILKRGSCNGWTHWFYDDPVTGERTAIDALRDQIRRQDDTIYVDDDPSD